MVTLKNSLLTVSICEKGAEVHSVKDENKREFIWTGNPDIWPMHAPMVFPICGGLKDDKYIMYGKEYTLQKHGFVRFADFEVEKSCDTCATFLLKSSEETLKQYPFDFELRVIYELNNKTLTVKYDVKNNSKVDMYYGIGGHEGYLCESGIEDYKIVFDKKETLGSYILNGNLLKNETIDIIKDTDTLNLKYEYFKVDALVFKDVKSKKLSLEKKDGTQKIDIEFDGFGCLMLWTKPGAPYICVEPWTSSPDNEDSDYDFTKKFNITKLAPNVTNTDVHKITFVK